MAGQLGDITFAIKTVNKTAEAVSRATRGLDKMKSSARGLETAQRAGSRATAASNRSTKNQEAALARATLAAKKHKLQTDRLALAQQKHTLQLQRFNAQQARSKQVSGSLYSVLTRIPTAYFGMAAGAAGAFRAVGQFTGAARQMNKEMANVATLIPGNRERVDSLKGSVQELAIKLGTGTGNLTDGLYQTISAYGDSAESARILEIQAKASRAGVATVSEALALTSAVTKGYGDTSAEANQKAADLAFTTVKLGQTNFPQLAASIGRVTPLAAELKVTQEDLFAVFATATGVTGSASEVATQYRGVLQSLMSPTASMTELYEDMGVESGKALIEQRGFPGALRAVVSAAKESNTPLQKYISSIEGQTLALSLTGAQADTWLEKSRAMVDTSGALDEAFREQTEGVDKAGAAWDRIVAKWEVTKQRIGDGLLPAIESLEPAINNVLDGFSQFATDLGEMVSAVGDAASGNDTLLDSFKRLLHTGAGIPAELLGISDAMDDTSDSAARLSDELAGHSVTTSFDKAREKGEKFLRMTRNIPQYVGRAVNDIGRLGAIGGNFMRSGEHLGSDFGAAFGAGFIRGVQPFTGTLPTIVGGVSKLPTFEESGFGSGGGWLSGFLGKLTGGEGKGLLGGLGDVMSMVRGGWQGIATKALNMVPVVGPLLSMFGPTLMKGLGKIGAKIGGWIKGVFGGRSKARQAAIDLTKSWADTAEPMFGNSMQRIETLMSQGWGRTEATVRVTMEDLRAKNKLTTDELDSMWKRYLDAVGKGHTETAQGILDDLDRRRSAEGEAADETERVIEKASKSAAEVTDKANEQRKQSADKLDKHIRFLEKSLLAARESSGKEGNEKSKALIEKLTAKIEDAYAKRERAAKEGTDKIADKWRTSVEQINIYTSRLKDRNINIHTNYTQSGDKPSGSGDSPLPGLATGGIVTRPTVAHVGEREPEAVIPLSKLRSMIGGNRTIIVQTTSGRELLRFTYEEGADVGDWMGIDRT